MLWIFILLCALGCDAPERDDGRIEVVCTTGMVADLARNIGGDRIAVVGMMGPGVDPHYYKASQGDLAKLTACGFDSLQRPFSRRQNGRHLRQNGPQQAGVGRG